MTSFRYLWCGTFALVLACAGGCGGSSGNRGSGGAGGQVDATAGTGGVDAASAGDTALGDGASDSADAQSDLGDASLACPVDGATVVDPFAGVWTGVQNNETFTFTNNGGCSSWTGSMSGTVCDICAGTYTATDAGTASATLQCHPTSACSTSPAHMDTGTFTLTGCSLTYDYNFGGGAATFTATRTSDTTAAVCASVDGGTD